MTTIPTLRAYYDRDTHSTTYTYTSTILGAGLYLCSRESHRSATVLVLNDEERHAPHSHALHLVVLVHHLGPVFI